jgi:hypothetical protein
MTSWRWRGTALTRGPTLIGEELPARRLEYLPRAGWARCVAGWDGAGAVTVR